MGAVLSSISAEILLAAKGETNPGLAAESTDMIEILVVDNDALLRGLLADWLGEAGYEVRVADSGENALRMLRRRPAGLLITDMDMPGGNGARTLDEVRSILPELPVIAMSG